MSSIHDSSSVNNNNPSQPKQTTNAPSSGKIEGHHVNFLSSQEKKSCPTKIAILCRGLFSMPEKYKYVGIKDTHSDLQYVNIAALKKALANAGHTRKPGQTTIMKLNELKKKGLLTVGEKGVIIQTAVKPKMPEAELAFHVKHDAEMEKIKESDDFENADPLDDKTKTSILESLSQTNRNAKLTDVNIAFLNDTLSDLAKAPNFDVDKKEMLSYALLAILNSSEGIVKKIFKNEQESKKVIIDILKLSLESYQSNKSDNPKDNQLDESNIRILKLLLINNFLIKN